MAWALVNVVQIALVGVWSVLWISVALLGRLLSGGSRLPLALARGVWAPGVLAIAGARLEVEAAAAAGPSVLVANHGSLLDIPALFAAFELPLHFVAKAELRRVPFLGWFISASGMVFVRRGQGGQTDRVAETAQARLREGGSIIFFPEGSRSDDGEVAPFRSGAFVTAIRVMAPVVPVAIAGARDCMPPRRLRLRPGRIRVRIGRPIPTAGLEPAAASELARRARAELLSLLAAAQASSGSGS